MDADKQYLTVRPLSNLLLTHVGSLNGPASTEYIVFRSDGSKLDLPRVATGRSRSSSRASLGHRHHGNISETLLPWAVRNAGSEARLAGSAEGADAPIRSKCVKTM